MTTDKGSVTLEWQPAVDAVNAPVEEYLIEVSKRDSTNFTEVGRLDGKQCKFKATCLEPGQKYYFRIKAYNQSGTSSGATLDRPVVASPIGKDSSFL